MTIVDAHVHLWDPARGDYGWLTPALGPLYRRFDADELRSVVSSAGVEGVVLVQAAPTAAESDYLVSIAQRIRWAFGVVGWVDFDDANVEATIAKRAATPKFVGVRPMLQDIADVDWIVAPQRGRALSALAAHGLVFDALIRPAHLDKIATIARRHADLSIVIDHAAKPAVGHVLDPVWRAGLRTLASHANVVCKLSGLLTEAIAGVDPERALDYAREVLDTFGPSRVLWGSDWPVLTQVASYERWFALTQLALAEFSDAERSAVLGGNAMRIYRLKPALAASPLILLHPQDNVLVCCRAVTAGEQFRVGAGEDITVLRDVDLGHKVARYPLTAGDKVIKYGASIGSMTKAAAAGDWVHMHNMRSDYISAHTRAVHGSEP